MIHRRTVHVDHQEKNHAYTRVPYSYWQSSRPYHKKCIQR
ncbi:Unknown protein sequence [Pseudomonas coronafaciens pv. oryzae]|nr:Unknown protein sequence [Pseudomonas coronafaciens pv. oryzae]